LGHGRVVVLAEEVAQRAELPFRVGYEPLVPEFGVGIGRQAPGCPAAAVYCLGPGRDHLVDVLLCPRHRLERRDAVAPVPDQVNDRRAGKRPQRAGNALLETGGLIPPARLADSARIGTEYDPEY